MPADGLDVPSAAGASAEQARPARADVRPPAPLVLGVEERRGLEAFERGAAVSLLDDRAIVCARGEDRASFLQGMLSNDVARLGAGEGTYALLLTEQGKVVADLRLLVVENALWLDVARELRERVREALMRFIVADDVELDDLPQAAVALRGPGAKELLGRSPGAGTWLDGLGECSHREAQIDGIETRVARVRDLGVDGFHLWAPDAAAALRLERVLIALGGVPCPAAAVEAWRIAAGWPRAGVDYDAQTLAPEVPSLARAISYKKGCYLGQEVVERVAARGHVNRMLVGLRAAGREALAPAAVVLVDGREVGRVMSSVSLPGDRQRAIATLRATAAAPGTRVVVRSEAGEVAAEVSAIPSSGSVA